MLPAVTGDDSAWGLLPKVGRGTCQRTWPLTLTSVAHACRGGTGPPHPGSSWLCDGRGELRGVVAAWVVPAWVVPQAARLKEQTATTGRTLSRLIRIPFRWLAVRLGSRSGLEDAGRVRPHLLGGERAGD